MQGHALISGFLCTKQSLAYQPGTLSLQVLYYDKKKLPIMQAKSYKNFIKIFV